MRLVVDIFSPSYNRRAFIDKKARFRMSEEVHARLEYEHFSQQIALWRDIKKILFSKEYTLIALRFLIRIGEHVASVSRDMQIGELKKNLTSYDLGHDSFNITNKRK